MVGQNFDEDHRVLLDVREGELTLSVGYKTRALSVIIFHPLMLDNLRTRHSVSLFLTQVPEFRLVYGSIPLAWSLLTGNAVFIRRNAWQP